MVPTVTIGAGVKNNGGSIEGDMTGMSGLAGRAVVGESILSGEKRTSSVDGVDETMALSREIIGAVAGVWRIAFGVREGSPKL